MGSTEQSTLEEGRRTIKFTTSEFTRPHLEVSRDGKVLYFDLLGEIYAVAVSGGKARMLDLGSGWKQRPMLSPDGKRLAFHSDRLGPIGVWVKRLDTDEEPVAYDARANADVISAAWVSDSEILTSGQSFYSRTGHNLLTASGSGLDSISGEPAAARRASAASIASSKDGRYVYFLRQGLMRLDRVSGVESKVPGMPDGAGQLRMAPDNVHLGFAPDFDVPPVGQVQFLSLLNVETGIVSRTNCALEQSVRPSANGASNPSYAFTPDGTEVLIPRGGLIQKCTLGGATTVVPVSAEVSIAISPQARLRQNAIGNQLRFPAASPRGNQIALTARGRIWLVSSISSPPVRLTQGSELEYMPTFSPNGAEIAYVSIGSDGRSSLRIRNIASGAQRSVISTDQVIANPTWSPDGRRLAYVKAPPNSSMTSDQKIELAWLEITGGLGGTFSAGLSAALNTNRIYPVPRWDRKSEGIFYIDSIRSGKTRTRQVFHQRIGEDRTSLFNVDWSVWDVAISPSGKFVAVHDREGIAIAPSVGSATEQMMFDRALIGSLKRVAKGSIDHTTWLPDDRFAWVVQDELAISDASFSKHQSMRISVPKAERASPATRVAYSGARIISMADGGIIENGLIVTNGSTVEYVGTVRDDLLKDVDVVNVKGKTIIPGLVDVHSHDNLVNLEVTPAIDQRLLANVGYGVTTVFDPSQQEIEGSVLREMSEEDAYLGATLYTSGSPLLGKMGNSLFLPIDSFGDAVKFIQRKKQGGSLMVKDYLQPSRNQRRWLAQAARQEGIRITAHESNDLATHMTLVVDGYSGMEHTIFDQVGRLYGDVRRFLVESEISMTPTLADGVGPYGAYFYETNPPPEMHFRCFMSDLDKKQIEKQSLLPKKTDLRTTQGFEMVRQYASILNQGGHVTIGAHTLPAGIGTHWEMWLLEMGGAKPMNVLRAGTLYGAKKLGLERKIGSLEVGKDADFVILNSNPLENIRNTADISRVVKRGRVMGWPRPDTQPTTWTMQGRWEDCKRWNLGAPRAGTYGFAPVSRL